MSHTHAAVEQGWEWFQLEADPEEAKCCSKNETPEIRTSGFDLMFGVTMGAIERPVGA